MMQLPSGNMSYTRSYTIGNISALKCLDKEVGIDHRSVRGVPSYEKVFPSHLLSSPFFSIFLLSRNSDSRLQSRLFSPPSHYGSCLAFLSREDFSSFSPRRLASNCPYPRHALPAADPSSREKYCKNVNGILTMLVCHFNSGGAPSEAEFSMTQWLSMRRAPSVRQYNVCTRKCHPHRGTPHKAHLETPVHDNREQEEGDVHARRDDGRSISNPSPNAAVPRTPPAVPSHQARATQHATKLQELVQSTQRMRLCGRGGGERSRERERRKD